MAREDDGEARRLIAALIADLFKIPITDVIINRDQYSLNSLNGFLTSAGADYFFKFHQEEGEEAMAGEYYRADILAEAGLPIDLPVYKSVMAGEQILIYRRRTDPRFSDVLRRLDIGLDDAAEDRAIAAETALNGEIFRVFERSLHPITAAESEAEPVHRLFHQRMIDPSTGLAPGGRYRQFYIGQRFRFPGADLSWDEFSSARICFNGTTYRRSVGALFEDALHRLDPRHLADAGGVIAHGDAHNANVWYLDDALQPRLMYFDPAFAGENVPALLAEVKATFHNCLAHPFWLYEPAEAERRYQTRANYRDGILSIETDWDLSAVRKRLLHAKAAEVWRPLLALLRTRGLLPGDWRQVIRNALFLCPTLVMNLRAGAATHNPSSSAIAFGVAVMVGSEPDRGSDLMTAFFDSIDPA
ncbi:hypothetical protein [Kaistia soli]|nr:hypothetical protein [Kaistia soli]